MAEKTISLSNLTAYNDNIKATYQAKTDSSLATTSKTVVGAINENKTQLDNITTEVTTIKPKVAEPITYEQWLALTQEEKDNGYWAVTDYPDETPTDLSLSGTTLKLKKADGTTVGSGITLPSDGSSSSVTWDNVTGKPSTFTPSSHRHNANEIDNLSTGIWDGVLTSENGTKYKVIVGNDGVLSTQPVVVYGQIVLNKTSLTITEGSSGAFTVALDKAPTNNQIVTLSKTNADVTLSPTALTFTPSNYATAQTVTITVAEDNTDYSSENDVITLTSPNVQTKQVDVAITDNDVAVTRVTLNKTTTAINAGSFETLTATIEPADATNKNVTWASSNNAIATVDVTGKVTGIADGSCAITCTSVADNSKASTCTVTVSSSTSVDVLTTTDFTLGSTGTITINYNQLSNNNIYLGIPLEKLNKFTKPNATYIIEYEIIENTFLDVLKDNSGATIFPAYGAITIADIGQVGKITFSKTTISSPNFENAKTQTSADRLLRLQVSGSSSPTVQSGILKFKIRVFLK